MSLKSLNPAQAREMIAQGAVLIDIRSGDEYAREHISQARCMPLDGLSAQALAEASGGSHTLIFHCRSGNRTRMNADRLESVAACEAYILEGGLDAWKRADLPVVADHAQPMELMRQVQIGAGSLVLLGVILGVWLSPWFLVLSAFVGAGLIFAGVSGFCGMARVLMLMPWNRRALKSVGAAGQRPAHS